MCRMRRTVGLAGTLAGSTAGAGSGPGTGPGSGTGPGTGTGSGPGAGTGSGAGDNAGSADTSVCSEGGKCLMLKTFLDLMRVTTMLSKSAGPSLEKLVAWNTRIKTTPSLPS